MQRRLRNQRERDGVADLGTGLDSSRDPNPNPNLNPIGQPHEPHDGSVILLQPRTPQRQQQQTSTLTLSPEIGLYSPPKKAPIKTSNPPLLTATTQKQGKQPPAKQPQSQPTVPKHIAPKTSSAANGENLNAPTTVTHQQPTNITAEPSTSSSIRELTHL